MRCTCNSLGYQCPSCDTRLSNRERYSHIHDARFDGRGNFVGRDRRKDDENYSGDWDD